LKKECHNTCLDCFDGARNNCNNCSYPLLYWNNQCWGKCPDSTFRNDTICEKCKEPCENCKSQGICLSCSESFYLIKGTTTCVPASLCPNNTYPDMNSRVCNECHESCLSCINSGEGNCIICNYMKGLSKPQDAVGRCSPLICPIGEYMKVDEINYKVSCEKCHKSCKACDGDGKNNCIECEFGYTVFPSNIENRVLCKSCTEINPGLTTDSNGLCKGIFIVINNKNVEICGDGINLGQLQCDDGNLYNGDGCSSDCKVESGFKCFPQKDGVDKCIDIEPPEAYLSVSKNNLLRIKFNEPVYTSLSPIQFIRNLEISLKGNTTDCNMTWVLLDNIVPYNKITDLKIEENLACDLKGRYEEFEIKFKNPDMILDYGNNQMLILTLKAKAKRFIYISGATKVSVEGTGSFFNVSSLITFLIVIGMNLLQSSGIGPFWALINMLQLLSYIPIIDCEIPYNLETFLTEYLTISKIAFPFQLVTGFMPDFLYYIGKWLIEPFNERFSICGYESLSFIYNFLDQLLTWVLLILFYIALRILTCIFPESYCKTIYRWRKEYEYNAVIRILLECYMNLVFCSFLNIWMVFLDKIKK